MRGVLISPYGDILPRLERLRSRGIAAVLVDRFGGSSRFSSVSVERVQIEVVVHTRGVEHIAEILAAMTAAGYRAERIG